MLSECLHVCYDIDMLTLLSVRLFNFRAVKDATFSPLRDGITGLSGPNGIGKSAFLEGTLWALFGEVPQDVSQSDLKNDQSSDEEECYVQVEFEHGGQKVIVTRSLRGKNRTAVLNTWLDGAPATVTGVTVGQRWITSRLGIDAKGFTTAVLVQQKELDGLVKAKPTERRALIERLSGVDKMSEALRSARAELSDAKHRAEGAHGSPEEISQAQEYASDCEVETVAAREALTSAQADLQERTDEYKSVNEVYEVLTKATQQAEKATNEIARYEEALAVAESNLVRAEEEASLSKGMLPNDEVPQGDVLSDARKQYSDAQAKYQAHREAINDARNSATRSSEDVSTKEQLLAHLKTAITDGSRDLGEARSTLEGIAHVDVDSALATHKSASAMATLAVSELATREAEVNALHLSIESLTGKDQCPTCHTSLTDATEVISSLSVLLERSQEERNAHERALNEANASLVTASEALAAAQNQSREVESLSGLITSLEDSLSHNKSKVDEVTNEIALAKKSSKEFSRTAEELTAELPALQAEGEKARELLSLAEGIDARVKAYLRVVAVRDEAIAYRDTVFQQVANSKEQLSNLTAPTPEELEAVTSDRNIAIERGAAAKELVQSLTSDLRVLEERLKHAESALEAAESAYNAKRALLDDVAQKSAVASVLDEFRKSQIARIAPELSDTATSLISRMTSGAFIEIELDEEFTPSVVSADGRSHPVAWLSGGELSVVALALRIAIGDMLTGGTGGLLWLDEVLVSQDAGRRASLIETLRSLNGRQIVMINHTQGADDIVDKSIRLKKSPDGGTVLDES